MKGYASRFYADTPQPYFQERSLPVPRSRVPHWELCRPDIRPALDPGDMVFFYAPGYVRGKRCPAACYGVLVVSKRVIEHEAARVLGREWLSWHRGQRCKHHSSRGENDGATRRDNIILGSLERSIWSKEGAVDLGGFQRGRLQREKKIGLRRNLFLSTGDCHSIYRVLENARQPLSRER